MTVTRQKRKAIRVERYYMETAGHIRYPGSWWHYKGTRTEIPVVCICIDDEAALIETAARETNKLWGSAFRGVTLDYEKECARRVLIALGIIKAKPTTRIAMGDCCDAEYLQGKKVGGTKKRAQPNAKPNKAKGGK